MTRFINFLLAGVLIASAIGVYSIKYEATRQAEKVAKLRRDIEAERIAIGTLKAEWAYLAQPERIGDMARKHSDLQPMKVLQIVKPAELPDKAQQEDEIAKKLEGLGLGAPTATGSIPKAAP